uniref:Uncharacterized protein n=1 Tax=Strigamia maritima TaxID=126957 RepID=T1ITZ5_STRMM
MLPSIQNDVVLLTFYNNLKATFLFLPIFPTCISLAVYSDWRNLRVDPPNTNNIRGTAKACLQTVLEYGLVPRNKTDFLVGFKWCRVDGLRLLTHATFNNILQ